MLELRQREPRERNAKHLAAVRRLPCLRCGRVPAGEAAHVRMACREAGKRETGMGETASDRWTLPLCPAHHVWAKDAQHRRGERAYWQELGIDPVKVAAALFEATGDIEAMAAIVRQAIDDR